MLKSSLIMLGTLLMLAAVAMVQPARLSAQESSFHSEIVDVNQSVAGEPVEIASLMSLPEAPDAVAPVKFEPAPFEFAPVVGVTPRTAGGHRFWDRENRILFAVAGGLAVADFCVTRANLAKGGHELNPVTRVFSGSTPGLAANFALETGGLISVNYLLHKTGHHKLERITSYVNVGSSAGAVAWGLSHR
ncbi:MAG TPA: hypothetical protein VKQ11_03565 [Candidatus Sulfotelmatobacter sp.]|nr:hypothetical protein [Candidatus Sulfotelmatobacter sp.]